MLTVGMVERFPEVVNRVRSKTSGKERWMVFFEA